MPAEKQSTSAQKDNRQQPREATVETDGQEPDGSAIIPRMRAAWTPADILRMQQVIGNQTVARMLSGAALQRRAGSIAAPAAPPVRTMPAAGYSDVAGPAVQRMVGEIKKKKIEWSNSVQWFDYTKKDAYTGTFTPSTRNVLKGTELKEAHPIKANPQYAWVVTANDVSGYLRTKDLIVTEWGEEHLPYAPNQKFLDPNRLLAPQGNTLPDPTNINDKQYQDPNREWYINQAFLLETLNRLKQKEDDLKAKGGDATAQQQIAETQKQLALAMLQSFSKSAPIATGGAGKTLGIQTTIFKDDMSYYRSTNANEVLNDLHQMVAKDTGLAATQLRVLSDPFFIEVLNRVFGVYTAEKKPLHKDNQVNTTINSIAEFKTSVKSLLMNYSIGIKPEGTFVFNVTGLYTNAGITPATMHAKLEEPLERILLMQVADTLKYHKEFKQADLVKDVLDNIQLVVMLKHKGLDVLVVPKLFQPVSAEEQKKLKGRNKMRGMVSQDTRDTFLHQEGHDKRKMESALIESGARLDPISAKKAMLEFAAPLDVLAQNGIKPAELATKSAPTPTVFANVNAFLGTPTFAKFRALSDEKKAPPYQKFYPAATADLLRGLAEVCQDKKKDDLVGIDAVFAQKDISDVLQMAYYRMHMAMMGASTYKSNIIQFMNQIELIHDQLQLILAVAEPHAPGVEFSKSILKALKEPPQKSGAKKPSVPAMSVEGKGVVPIEPVVHHKASAMHTVASILSSIEQQKEGEQGTRNLNALVLKDNYYEAHGAVLEHSKTYTVEELNGWELHDGTQDVALKDSAFGRGEKPKGKIDIFICDFHHNISVERSEYKLENVTYQVEQLVKKKIMADKFTVAIDCTVDFLRSDDIRKFLEKHKSKIENGQMNVVLYRSAQKFDMLGMDNYYGGYTITINNGKDFQLFNERMKMKEDQVTGLAHQGLAHLTKFGSQHQDAYRKALMDNTRKLYRKLEAKGLTTPASPIYIGKTEDPHAVFLDIQFPEANEETGKFFFAKFQRWAQDIQKLAFTTRPSFGFATTNFTEIAGTKVRLNPGLEDETAINKYVEYFTATKEMLEKARDEAFKAKARATFDVADYTGNDPVEKKKHEAEKAKKAEELGKHLEIEYKFAWATHTVLSNDTSKLPQTATPEAASTEPAQISGPVNVPGSGVNTKDLKKPTQASGDGSRTAPQLPAPAPLQIAKGLGSNPTLYFTYNRSGDYNFMVASGNPGAPWQRVEQFCAYLATYWLTHGSDAAGLRFGDLPFNIQLDGIQTLTAWASIGANSGLDGQVTYAATAIGGQERSKTYVHKKAVKAAPANYKAGTRIWFGTNAHARAAVVLPDGRYRVYDPNTGATTEISAANFVTVSDDANKFVVQAAP